MLNLSLMIIIDVNIVEHVLNKYRGEKLKSSVLIIVVIIGGIAILIWLNEKHPISMYVLIVVSSLLFMEIKIGSTARTDAMLKTDSGDVVMNKDEGHREIMYQMTMSVARKMIAEGLLTRDEYRAFESEMQKKYKPIIGELFSNINLL